LRTIRRIYLYLVTFISLELMVWGLAQAGGILLNQGAGSAGDLFGNGLALFITGLPIFIIHWLLAQRDARLHPEGQPYPVRTVFLYIVSFICLFVALFSLLVLLNWVDAFWLRPNPPHSLLFNTSDGGKSLCAIFTNLAAWSYFLWVRQKEKNLTPTVFVAQRLLRHVWFVLSLLLSLAGVAAMLTFLFSRPAMPASERFFGLSNGLSFTLVGLPLLVWATIRLREGARSGSERLSSIRRVTVYSLAAASALICMASIGGMLAGLSGWIMGASQTLKDFLNTQSQNLAWGLCTGAMWLIFHQTLLEDAELDPDPLHRAGLRRLYFYFLAFLGLISLAGGLANVLDGLVELLLSGSLLSARTPLAGGMAASLLGLPVWLWTWREVQKEARLEDQAGDHARRSVLRKGYLYLVLFILVVGSMVVAVTLLQIALDRLQTRVESGFAASFVSRLAILLLLLAWLYYHWRVLSNDNHLAHHTLSQRHAEFTLVIFQPDEDDFLSNLLVRALQHEVPRMPILVHRLDAQPLDALETPDAVVLPWQCAVEPPASLRLWLSEYKGPRVVVPLITQPWQCAGQRSVRPSILAVKAAHLVRELAENK